MTENEFDFWVADYCVRYTGVGTMLSQSQSLTDDWYHLLKKYSEEDMKAATREVLSLDPQPYPSEHLSKLVGFLKTISFVAPKPIDIRGTATPKCETCDDRGYVRVFHPNAYEPIRANTWRMIEANEIVVACFCEAAEKFKRPKSKNGCEPLIEFDANRMLPTNGRTAKDLIQFVDNHYKPMNYNAEFADWDSNVQTP